MPTFTGINIDRQQKLQKYLSPLYSGSLIYVVSNFIKTEALATFVQNYGLKDDRYQYWQLSNLTGIKNRKKTIATIEFTTLNFCKVRNVIKIEAFAVLGPKLWPKNWQVSILTGGKNYKKILSPLNSGP